VALPAAPRASAWTPQPPSYGVGTSKNIGVKMADGTILRADVYYPTDPTTGAAAAGPFPAILTQTPYGKNAGGAVSNGGLTGENPYLVRRGYIDVVVDVRGTGGSQGEWGFFDPVQASDGATLVQFVAHLPHANGIVGLLGESYLAINQFLTAAVAGPAHVKALFPVVASDEIYRDIAFAGGFPDIEFDSFYLALTASLNSFGPVQEGNPDFATALSQHVRDIADFDAQITANIESGGELAYDGSYWQQRSPFSMLERIVREGIPAFLIGGWYDVFQRGELLNYAALQNAYAGRPLLAPMRPDEPVTPRYQLIQGPWYHVTAPDGLSYHGLDINGLELAWFDHWLKRVDTGITATATPLHLEDLASGRYVDTTRYPLSEATPATLYLGAGGTLSPAAPAARRASDPLVYDGTEIPCTSSTAQWAAGAQPLALSFFGLKDPCTQNVNLSQLGPGTQSYTTAPFTAPTTLAGPVGATLYATSTRGDTEWVVQLSDVAPDGTATALTSGVLEGNQRALEPSRTWYAPDGHPMLPWHPYTEAAQAAVPTGKVTRYDVEVFPTYDTLAPGHRLRVTIATADFPHAFPDTAQGPGLAGGMYAIERSADAPSSVELPLIGPGAPHPSPVAATPLGCPRASGALSRSRLGPVTLGMTRPRARRAFVASSTHGLRYIDYFCLTPVGIRVGYPSAALLRSLPTRVRRQVAGRVVLALTANRAYSLRGVRVGARVRSVARRLRLGRGIRVGLNTWYFDSAGGARGVVMTRRGTVWEIGITDPRLARTRGRQRRFIASFS
jgi:putative CocE/NonD family hydrolase